MGVPTWHRFAAGLVWTCTRRRWSRRRSTRGRVSCASRGCRVRRARWRRSARALPGPVRVAYEAGPTGFGLARELAAVGVGCVVAAPGKIARAPQDRVKTDRRDAERLVRLLMAGELHRGPGAGDRRGGVARSGPRAGGSARRSDADASPGRQAAAASRRSLGRATTGRRRTGTGWPASRSRSRSRRRARRRPRRDRRAAGPPRQPRAPDDRAGPGLAVGDGGRAAAVPARHRHAHRRSGCAPRSATSTASGGPGS